MVTELERLRSTTAAVELAIANEVDAGGHAKAAAWGSTADFLTAASGGYHGTGNRMLRTARPLCAALSATKQALLEGGISAEHAAVIVRVVGELPDDAELRGLAEKVLLQEAEYLNATELRTAALHLWELIDPDGFARREEKKVRQHERSAHLNRFLSIADDGLGGVKIRGRGTVEDAAVIKAALAAMSAPAAKDLTNSDPEFGTQGCDIRDHGARMWDGLVEVCAKSLDAEVLPTCHPRMSAASHRLRCAPRRALGRRWRHGTG